MTRDTYINASLVCDCVYEPLELNKEETLQNGLKINRISSL